MEKLNGWIPVKERLPETETEVLVLCPILGEWRVRVAMLTKRLNLWVGVGGTLQGSFFFYGTEPVFWKPLPDLPEGVDAQ